MTAPLASRVVVHGLGDLRVEVHVHRPDGGHRLTARHSVLNVNAVRVTGARSGDSIVVRSAGGTYVAEPLVGDVRTHGDPYSDPPRPVVCVDCGALVGDQEAHRTWHEGLGR